MAKALQIGIGVGAAFFQPENVIDLGGFGDVTEPQTLCAERMVSKLARADGPPPASDSARRG
ncbi:hypothetical protein [Paraburkholderia sp. Tr-20389]|uniref:hypothetical protein n=1 Tax=Paraburkholderia sp. Tr-20389 TaxID=2703903 RepID=UPI003217D842